MAVTRPRNRLVYFRVSEDEFARYTEMCRQAGARSLSDLARSAMQQMLLQKSEDVLTAGRLRAFDERIAQLNQKLEQLTNLLPGAGTNGSGSTSKQ